MPTLATLVSLFLATVTLLACRRYGVRSVVPLAAIPALIYLTGISAAPILKLLAAATFIGLLAAYQLERGRPYGEVIAVAALPGFAMAFPMVMDLILEGSPDPQFADRLGSEFEAAGLGVMDEGRAEAEQLAAQLLRLQPAVPIVSALLTAVLGYRFAWSVAPRLGMGLPSPPSVHQWRLWDALIWLFVAATATALLGSGAIRDLAFNTMFVIALLYGVQGFALARHFAKRLSVPVYLELLFYGSLMLSAAFGLILLVGAGLMETWFDWRRLSHRRETVEEESQH